MSAGEGYIRDAAVMESQMKRETDRILTVHLDRSLSVQPLYNQLAIQSRPRN